MNAFKLLATEFKKLTAKKGVLIAVIGVLLIPIIYAAILLSATWGPYDNLNKLPVAVVNNDEGGVSNGQPINVGNDLVEELKNGETLGWDFVTEEKALAGLDDNDYYMVIVIPEDFSKKAVTVLDSNPQIPELQYIQNEGLNFLASQVTNNAVNTLKASLGDKITATYARSLFSQLGAISEGFDSGADGSNQIYDGTVTLSDGTNTLLSSLTEKAPDIAKLADGASTADQGAGTLLSSVQGGTGDINKLAAGSGQVLGGLNSLDAGLGTIGDGVNKLAAGVKTVPNAFASQFAPAYAKQFADGYSSQFSGQFAPAFAKGFVEGQAGKSGFEASFAAGLNQVSSGVATAAGDGFNTLRKGIKDGADGGFAQYNSSIATGIKGGVDTLNAGIEDGVVGALAQYSEGVTSKVGAGVQEYKSKVAESVTGASQQLAAGVTGGIDTYKATVEGQLNSDEAKAQTKASVDAAAADLVGRLEVGISNPALGLNSAQIAGIKNILEGALPTFGLQIATNTSANVSNQILGGLTPLKAKLEGSITGTEESFDSKLITGLNTGTDTFVGGVLGGLADGTAQLKTGLVAGLQTGTESFRSQLTSSIENGSNQLKTQLVSSINDGTNQVETGIVSGVSNALDKQLKPQVISGLKEGLDTNLNSALSENINSSLNENINSSLKPAISTNLATGIKPIVEGFDGNSSSPGLVNGVASASSGVNQLIDGQSQIAAGTNKLVTSWGTLTNGAAALKDGLGQISDGTATVNTGWTTLTEGATQLDEGATKLKDGSKELATGLSNGSEEVKSKLTVSDNNIEMFSSPVNVNGEKVNDYTYYRDSTAPYILSLALFVGMLILSLFVDFKKPAVLPSSPINWYLSKLLQLSIFAIIQGLILSVFTLVVIGLDVEKPGLFILFAMFVSLSFMAIIFFLVSVAGNVGRYIALIFIVLQLSTTGANLPTIMLPDGLEKFSKFLPLTYSNGGFKSVISLGDFGLLSTNTFILLIYFLLGIGLALIVFFLSFKSLSKKSLEVEGQLN